MRYTCPEPLCRSSSKKIKIMTKRKGLIALAVAAVLMTGCAQNKMWINPGVTNEQAKKEFAECQYDVVKHTPSYDGVSDPIAAGITSGMRKNEIMSTCMSSKGYSLQSQKEPQGLTEQQKAIQIRYSQALAKFKEKSNLIGESIIDDCRPKDDKGYIDCLNQKQAEQVTIGIFHDIITKMFKVEEEFKQQLYSDQSNLRKMQRV
jgi:hypothetical protein